MEEKMDRIERQLRLYELVCSYAVTGFETIEEAFRTAAGGWSRET